MSFTRLRRTALIALTVWPSTRLLATGSNPPGKGGCCCGSNWLAGTCGDGKVEVTGNGGAPFIMAERGMDTGTGMALKRLFAAGCTVEALHADSSGAGRDVGT